MIKRPSKSAFIQALHQHQGSRRALAKHYQVSRQSIWKWLQRYDLLDEIGAYDKQIDYDAKQGLAQRIHEGDWDAIKFWYNTVRDKVIKGERPDDDQERYERILAITKGAHDERSAAQDESAD